MNKCDGNHAEKIPCLDPECWFDKNRPYNIWWFNLGSMLGPMHDEDPEEHVHRVTRVAWDKATTEARNDLDPLTNALGAILSYLLTQEQTFKSDIVAGKITEFTLAEWGIRAHIKGDHIELSI